MAVSLALFAGAVGAGFHWDDELLFRSWLPYLEGPGSLFSPSREIPHFTFQYFRPLVLASYVVDEKLAAGLFSPEAREQGRRVFFHLTPVLLHVACTALVFLLAARLGRGAGRRETSPRWVAFAAAVLFATHPIHVETVAWIVGRSDSIATLLGLGSLWAFLGWRERLSRPSLLVAGLLLFLALLAKETALGLLLPALVIGTSRDPSREAGRMGAGAARLAEVACLVAVLALYVVLRAAFGTDAGSLSAWNGAGPALSGWLGASGWYAAKALWPYPHAVFPPEHLGPGFVILGVLAAGGVVAGFVAARGRAFRAERAALALAVGGVAAPLAVALTSLSTSPVAERHLYLSSAGCCLLAAFLLARLTSHPRLAGLTRLPLVALLAGAIAVPWGWTTSQRLRLWDDPIRFWTVATETAPRSPVAFINLGQSLTAAGRLVEAGAAYRRAATLATAPDQIAMAHANLGALHLRRGDLDGAIGEFDTALHHDPRDATSYFNWASALVKKAEGESRSPLRAALLEEAGQRLDAALAIHPRYARAHLLLGTIRLRRGDPEAARLRLETAASLDPTSGVGRRAREMLLSMPPPSAEVEGLPWKGPPP